MTTYSNSRRPKVNYRKIWESYNGPIPVDDEGRSFEIHHIDGNPSNNDIANLQALSIQDHYDIHYSQGDWFACYLIKRKMRKSSAELSKLSKKSNQQRVNNGTHNFLGGDLQRRLIKEGRHPSQNPTLKSKETISYVVGRLKESTQERLLNGTHPFIETGFNSRMIAEGKHTSVRKLTCPHCGKTCSANTAKQWHFDNCKHKD